MEKIFTCIKNIGVWHSFEKNETATMCFLQKPFLVFYCCGLSTVTIEYSCPSVCLCVYVSFCLSVCLYACVHDNSKNNGSIHFKLEHIIVYKNSSDEFNIGHCLIKIKIKITV